MESATNVYQKLARKLDALPNGFPPTEDGAELRLLARLFTPEEAELACQLRMELKTPAEIAAWSGREFAPTRKLLKDMTRKGLIAAGPVEDGVGFGLMPFVVGIYEMQVGRMDRELAELFEAYYPVFGRLLTTRPSVHRVIPVNESVRSDLEVRPFDSAAGIINANQAWGVVDCICRTQKALIGEGCEHPLDVCMVLSNQPKAFDHSSVIRPLTQTEAHATLKRAADAGLVHSVSNNQQGLWYICNCCTCSCGILRGMADLGLANVVARSPYVNTVDEARCGLCGACVEKCMFDALEIGMQLEISGQRCVGCGVCTLACPEEALTLVLRSEEQAGAPPVTLQDWMAERARARGIPLEG